jgi:hypothetical protein
MPSIRRPPWSSWPSRIVIASSVADLAIIPAMTVNGILMAPPPVFVVLVVFAASVALAFVLDQVKVAIFRWLRMGYGEREGLELSSRNWIRPHAF